MNLQDLVYKRGQAGITKASVTIVFNNSDPKQSPIGYTDYPQITITRQVTGLLSLTLALTIAITICPFVIRLF